MTDDPDIARIRELWYEQYPPHVHEMVGGFNDETTDGKTVVIFQNRLSGLISHAYLKEDRLMPFFPNK